MSSELADYEGGLDRFFDASLDLMCIAGSDGYFKRVNHAWMRALGWSEEELLAQPYVRFVHPDDVGSTHGAAGRLAEGKDIVRFQNRYRCKDGSYRLLMWRATPDPQRGLIYCAARDITDEALAEQRMQTVVDNASAVIAMKDADGRYRLVNRRFEDLFNITREEVAGKRDEDIFPSDMARAFRENDIEVLKTGKAVQFEEMAPHADGPHTYVSVKFPILDARDKAVAVCVIATDITDRKRAERAIEEREARLNAILETAVEGIVTMGEDWIILTANPAAQQMFGYAAREIAGQSLDILMPESFQSKCQDCVRRYVQTDEEVTVGSRREIRGRRKDGTEFPLELSISEMHIDGVRMFTAMMHDTTGRQAAEDELKRSNRDLEQFAYVASHDLKEPLRMISSYLQIIEKRYADCLDDEGRQYFGFAMGGAARLRALINDLLLYSRVGAQGSAMGQTSTQEVLDEVLENLRLAISESGAVITHDELPTVRADPGQLRQVLQNLLANSLKFRGADPPRLHVGCQWARGRWKISVEDNGIGIAAEHFDRIFVIFQRLHGREQFEGTGIGLALCKKIIERHGGEIWVESLLGQGTKFFFTIAGMV